MRLLTLCILLCATVADAKVMPLTPLPELEIAKLATTLGAGDLALIESNPDGTMRQVTLLLLVRAAPELVHEVLAHPGEYRHFVRNVSKSSWQVRPDGIGISAWQLDLPVSSFTQISAYRFDPGPTAPVHVTSVDDAEDATWRWELVPVDGGGTILVQYGYTDVKHSSAFVRSFLKKMPVTEHGLALAAQLLLASNVRAEAEKRSRAAGNPPAPPTGKPASFGFLLQRGQVVVMRSDANGALSDVSLIDRVFAPVDKIRAALAAPAAWPRFVPGVDTVDERRREAGQVAYHLDFSVPMVTWSSDYVLRLGDKMLEGFALAGDLRGAHFRWDLTARGPSETTVVYRVNQRLGQSSVVFRKLIQHDPSLEHGLNVAFSLVYLRGIRGKAEGWPGY